MLNIINSAYQSVSHGLFRNNETVQILPSSRPINCIQQQILPWDIVRKCFEEEEIIDEGGIPLDKAYRVKIPLWSNIQKEALLNL